MRHQNRVIEPPNEPRNVCWKGTTALSSDTVKFPMVHQIAGQEQNTDRKADKHHTSMCYFMTATNQYPSKQQQKGCYQIQTGVRMREKINHGFELQASRLEPLVMIEDPTVSANDNIQLVSPRDRTP